MVSIAFITAFVAAYTTTCAAPIPTAVEFEPDPASVTRHGPAWRYPQAGWHVVHIEGAPYDRGFQHGRLLAAEIVDYIESLAAIRSHSAPHEAWRGAATDPTLCFCGGSTPNFSKK